MVFENYSHRFLKLKLLQINGNKRCKTITSVHFLSTTLQYKKPNSQSGIWLNALFCNQIQKIKNYFVIYYTEV